MSRITYGEADDTYNILAAGRWEVNSRRAVNGKPGQKILRELEAILLAMPKHELVTDDVCTLDEDGNPVAVCVLGAWGLAKGIDAYTLSRFNGEDVSELWNVLGGEAKMTYTLAWELMEKNDERFSHCTPAERWEKMLAWVRERIHG